MVDNAFFTNQKWMVCGNKDAPYLIYWMIIVEAWKDLAQFE